MPPAEAQAKPVAARLVGEDGLPGAAAIPRQADRDRRAEHQQGLKRTPRLGYGPSEQGVPIVIEPIARVRIELQGIEPKIWRRVDVPLSSTLMSLHDIIQVAMRWQDYHLFKFVVGNKLYGEPHPDDVMYDRKVYKAKGIRLGALIERGVRRFLYVYDFGDDWRHDVVIEDVRTGAADIDYPAFVDGARRAPPEDVGGVHGFMDFLEAVLDPGHEEHARLVTWYGGSFDPADIDERDIRAVLSMFADRRKGPLASHRSGRRGRRGSSTITS